MGRHISKHTWTLVEDRQDRLEIASIKELANVTWLLKQRVDLAAKQSAIARRTLVKRDLLDFPMLVASVMNFIVTRSIEPSLDTLAMVALPSGLSPIPRMIANPCNGSHSSGCKPAKMLPETPRGELTAAGFGRGMLHKG